MESLLTKIIEFFDDRNEQMTAFKAVIMALAAVALGAVAWFLGYDEGGIALGAFIGLALIYLILE